MNEIAIMKQRSIKIGVTTLLFLTTLIVQAQKKEIVDKVIAVVGDEIILYSDIKNQLFQAAQQGIDLENQDNCTIMEELLMEKLLLNQAKLDSVEVTEAQVEDQMNRRLNYFIQMIGSEKKLEEYYQKPIAQIKKDLYRALEDQLRVQTMQQQITSGITVTPTDVRKFYESIPQDSLPYVGSQVEYAQIVIDPPISPEERSKVKKKLNEYREEIISGDGKDFETVAMLYSQDPGSARNGGELGMTARGNFVPEFDAIAFSLSPGQVSEVFETQFGFHIMRLIERRGDRFNAQHILLKPKVKREDMQEAKETLDKIAEKVKSEELTFEEAAEQYSDDEQTRNNGGVVFNMETGSTKFEMDDLDSEMFFIIDKMKVGDISKPALFNKPDGSQAYRIIKLISQSDPHVANLRDDYSMIQNAALGDLKEKELMRWVDQKIKSTYINIKEDFGECMFEKQWVIK